MNIFKLFFYFIFNFLFCVTVFSSNIKEELSSFIETNNLAEIKRILDNNKKLDFTFFDEDKIYTPLGLAAFWGHKEIVEYLIQKDFDINIKNSESLTALHIAIMKGHKDICELLISHNADLGTLTATNKSVVSIAVKYNHFELTKYLIEKIIELKYQNGEIPQNDELISQALHVACLEGNNNIIDLLLDQKWQFKVINIKKELDYSPLHLAVLMNKLTTVDLLIKKGANVNVERNEGNYKTPLHTACMGGNSETVKLLLENGALTNITNFDGEYPINIAIKEGHKNIVELFVERQDETLSYVSLDGHKSLFLAAINSRMPLVKYLLEQGQSISNESLELISNKEIKNYILFYKNSIKLHNLNDNIFYATLTRKALNLVGNQDQKLATEIKFEAINTKENLYKVSFIFTDNKQQKTKTIYLKVITDLNNSEKIVSLKFYEYNKQKGFIEKASTAYNEDITHKKNNKTGKLVRDEKILLFEKEFLIEYNNDFSELNIIMKSGKFLEVIKLSNAPLDFINKTSQVGKKVEVENLPPAIIKDNKIRPSIQEFLPVSDEGILYKVLCSSENILYVKIYKNLIKFYYGNTEIKDCNFTLTIIDEKVKSLKYLGDIYEVSINKEGQLVFTLDNSKSKKRAFEMVLEKTNEQEPYILSNSSNISISIVKEDKIKPKKLILEEPIEEKISKNKQKKNRNKNRRAKKILKQQNPNLLPDVPEAKQASNFSLVLEETEIENFIITEPKKIEQIIQEEKYVLPYEKDHSEFLGKTKLAIKLKPTDHKECPLLNGVWQGFGFNTINDKLSNKRIILSLTQYPRTKRGLGKFVGECFRSK
jgi:ankyrin repeat protein